MSETQIKRGGHTKTSTDYATTIIKKLYSQSNPGRIISDIVLNKIMKLQKVYPIQTGTDVSDVNTIVANFYSMYSDIVDSINESFRTIDVITSSDNTKEVVDEESPSTEDDSISAEEAAAAITGNFTNSDTSLEDEFSEDMPDLSPEAKVKSGKKAKAKDLILKGCCAEFTDDKSFQNEFKKFLTSLLNTRLDVGNIEVPKLSEKQVSSTVRDAIVVSLMRGLRIHILSVNPKYSSVDSDKGPGNLHQLLSNREVNKTINGPMEPWTPESGMSKIDYNNYNMPHHHDSKLPYTELSDDTLAIFLRKNSPFSQYVAKKYYNNDSHYIDTTYPTEKYIDQLAALDEAKKMPTTGHSAASEGGDFIITPVYVNSFLQSLLLALCQGSPIDYNTVTKLVTSADKLLVTKSREGTFDSLGAAPGSDEYNIGDEMSIYDPDGSWSDRPIADEDSDTLDTVAQLELKNNEDAIPKFLWSKDGNEDRRFVTVFCREVLNDLWNTIPNFSDKFSFNVLTTNQAGIGSIETDNLYYHYFDKPFTYFGYSESGAAFLYQIYNGSADDAIEYSYSELQELRKQLPKSINSIKLRNNPVGTTLLGKFDTESSESNPAVKVAIENVNAVLNGSLKSGFKPTLVQELVAKLNPEPVTLPATAKAALKVWLDTEDEPENTNTVSEARVSRNKPATNFVDNDTAFDNFISGVKEFFEALDPNNGIKVTAASKPIFMYPTEDNSDKNGVFIFQDKLGFTETVHDLVTKLIQNKEAICSAQTPSASSNIILHCFNEAIPPQNLMWKHANRIGLLSVLPNIYSDAGKTQIRPIADLTSGRLGANISNKLIHTVLFNLITDQRDSGFNDDSDISAGKRFTGVAAGRTNSALCIIALLHSRFDFLMAVRALSDAVEDVIDQSKITLRRLPAESKRFLSNYEFSDSPYVKEILNKLVKDVSHRIISGADSFIKGDETDEVIHPEFKEYLDNHSAEREKVKEAAARRRKLRAASFSDDDI